MILIEQNSKSFGEVCSNNYGRQVLYTNKSKIDASNIVEELNKVYMKHLQNAREIDYLDRYYRGDQPILYRNKLIRPEIDNRVVENLAFYIVETKASEIAGEPIQYVLRGTDEVKGEQINQLNAIVDSEDKSCDDIEICRWRSICGTAYRFIGKDDGNGSLLDESEFYLSVEDPRRTFVAYYHNDKPAFACKLVNDEDGNELKMCYTNTEVFLIKDSEIIDSSRNGNLMIPIIEYPNNVRRLSDIEITISITDEINAMASSRADGIEGFVNSYIKFVNCEIDEETYRKMRQEGAFVVKSNNGSENKADVDIMTNELNQSESQVAVADQFEKLLIVQGIANREGSSGGGDTQGAVNLRNGFYTQEKRAEIYEPIFKKAERQTLKLILNRLRISKGFTLEPSDVEIKISRSKLDNLQIKAESLQMLLNSGINPARAIKTVGLFSDPEQVASESKKRMDVLYPTDAITEVPNEVIVTE